MEVNVYCGKELFILQVAGVLCLLPQKMTSSRFLLLCYDVEKRKVEHTLDFHIHFETVFVIIVLPVLK